MASPKDLLEGKPFRSPLHPALVHLPIGLFPLSVLLDLASWVFQRPEWMLVRVSFLAIGGGLVTGLLAGLFGFVDYTEIRDDHPAKKTATLHMILNLAALMLFGLGFGLRFDSFDAVATPLVPLLVSLVGLALLGYSGYLGGDLVYNDGVGVGRHRHAARLPQSTVTVKEKPRTWVAVGDAAALPVGGTLRVDANGTVIALARTTQGYHAFQEFCTHRYGPMSEGGIDGCEVICPWHRSRFDVRTGKVTAGPAKVDLKTFRVEAREGKLWVEVPEGGERKTEN